MLDIYKTMQPSVGASFFWSAYEYRGVTPSDDADIADLDTTNWYELDVKRGLAGASTIDEGYRNQILEQACQAMELYVQYGLTDIKKVVLQKHIDALRNLTTWDEFIDAFKQISSIKKEIEAASLRAENNKDKVHSSGSHRSSDADKILFTSVLPGTFTGLFANPAPKAREQLFKTYELLEKLQPVKGRRVNAHNAKNCPEVLEWRAQVCTIDDSNRFKCMKDFVRDFAINGKTGEQRKPKRTVYDSLQGDELISIEQDILRDIDQLCADQKDGKAIKEFILSSGGQDMTRFAEEIIFQYLEIKSHAGKRFRICKSESCGNWYKDESGAVCFDLKIYASSLVELEQHRLLVMDDEGRLMEREPDEWVSKRQKNKLLPKVLQVEAKLTFDEKVRPAVQCCDFTFYSDQLDLGIGAVLLCQFAGKQMSSAQEQIEAGMCSTVLDHN